MCRRGVSHHVSKEVSEEVSKEVLEEWSQRRQRTFRVPHPVRQRQV